MKICYTSYIHSFKITYVNSFLRVFTIEDLLLQPTDYFSRIVRKSLYVDLSPWNLLNSSFIKILTHFWPKLLMHTENIENLWFFEVFREKRNIFPTWVNLLSTLHLFIWSMVSWKGQMQGHERDGSIKKGNSTRIYIHYRSLKIHKNISNQKLSPVKYSFMLT